MSYTFHTYLTFHNNTRHSATGMPRTRPEWGKGIIMAAKKYPAGKYAWTATVGEKGQIVIPKQAREVFGIKPGDTLILLGDIKRGIAIPPKSAFDGIAATIFGSGLPKDDESESGD